MVNGLSCLWHGESSWARDHTMSPQFAGRFFTTGLPGMSCHKPLTCVKKKKKRRRKKSNICNKFSSVGQSCPILCDPMDCSTPGFSVHHQLPEFTQTHVHSVSDVIQPSSPLSSPSLPHLQSFPASGSFQMTQFFT